MNRDSSASHDIQMPLSRAWEVLEQVVQTPDVAALDQFQVSSAFMISGLHAAGYPAKYYGGNSWVTKEPAGRFHLLLGVGFEAPRKLDRHLQPIQQPDSLYLHLFDDGEHIARTEYALPGKKEWNSVDKLKIGFSDYRLPSPRVDISRTLDVVDFQRFEAGVRWTAANILGWQSEKILFPEDISANVVYRGLEFKSRFK